MSVIGPEIRDTSGQRRWSMEMGRRPEERRCWSWKGRMSLRESITWPPPWIRRAIEVKVNKSS